LLLGTLPWGFLAAARTRRPAAPPDRRIVFLLLWVFVPLLFFSLSQSKRPQYMLPLVPAVALLAAALWTRRGVRAAAAALAILGAVLLASSARLPLLFRNMTPEIAAAVPGAAIPLAIICIAAGAAAFFARGSREAALLALCVPCASIPFVSQRLMKEIGNQRSAAALAQAIAPTMLDATEIVGIHAYPPSLPFYLHRTTILASDDAREMTSNYILRTAKVWADAPGTPLRPADWWREAAVNCERPRVFVVALADREALLFLGERLPLIAQAGKYAAFGPCGGHNLAAR
jgi:4-amino-4-deoxy-L-arabinose transferase-like glycosyltransferase